MLARLEEVKAELVTLGSQVDVSRKQAMKKKDGERRALGEVEHHGDTIRSARQDLADANSWEDRKS